MRYLHSLQEPPELEEFAQKVGLINRRPPRDLFSLDDNIPFHATRLLLLIRLAGRPKSKPRIEGRTKLAKLDFFVRYAQFLERATRIFSADEQLKEIQSVLKEGPTVEAHMIRYRYGPWDRRYYLVLAYLSGKGLIDIQTNEGVDQYLLTDLGNSLTSTLLELPDFESIVKRCQIVGDLFGGKSGSWIKDFVYRHFPEVVRTHYNQLISPRQDEEGTNGGKT
jgi:hypothetical protein